MALIGRLFVILFAFLAACLVAGMIVVGAVLFPEFTDLGIGTYRSRALNVVLGFGFIFISGFALLPALIVAADNRGLLYQQRARLRARRRAGRAACYLGLIPFDPETMRFDGIVRRHLEIMTGAGIVAGLIYWLIAGRNAGAWRGRLAPAASAAARAVEPAAAVAVERGISQPFHPRFASAKPRAMNRTGLFIALGLSLVVCLLFGLYPELDLKLSAMFYDAAAKTFPLKVDSDRRRRCAMRRCGSHGALRCPRSQHSCSR